MSPPRPPPRSPPRAARAGLLVAVLVLVWFSASWWGATRLLLPDRARPAAPPTHRREAYEAVVLTTSDGVELDAWVVEPEGPVRGTLVMVHGRHGQRSVQRVELANRLGFRAVTADLRGHGTSGDAFTGFGWHERRDVEALFELAWSRGPHDPVVGWGVSMGAAALVYALDPEGDGPAAGALIPGGRGAGTVRGLVLESLYPDIETAFSRRVALGPGSWSEPLLGGVRRLVAWRSDLVTERLSPETVLTRLTPSCLVLATGAEDRHAPGADMQRLVAGAPGARTILVAGVGHRDLVAHGDPAYRDVVEQVLLRWGDEP